MFFSAWHAVCHGQILVAMDLKHAEILGCQYESIQWVV